MVDAAVTSGGELSCDGQIVGRLQGFRVTPEASPGVEPVSLDNADFAAAIVQEFEVRANRLSEAVDSSLVLANDGAIRWLGDPVAKIAAGETLFAPRALILADESLTGEAQQKVQARLDLWLAAYVQRLLGPLFELEAGAGLEGAARNVAARLAEALGVLERGRVAQDVKTLDQNARGMLRKLGVRFGAYYIYIPSLVKPAIRVLATQLWALRQGGAVVGAGLEEIPQLAASGRTSFLADSAIPKETYRVAGFRLCGDRAVRVDIVERLADLIRPAIAYRPGANAGEPPAGSADADGFVVTGAMTSLTGCSGEQFASVLRSLGFVSERVKGPALTFVKAASEAPAAESESAPATAEEAPSVEPLESAAEAGSVWAKGESAETEAASAEPVQPVADPPLPVVGEAAVDILSPEAFAEVPVESAPSAPADGEVRDETIAAAEEVLIEVWRPRPPNRQHRPRPRARESAHAPAREASEAAAQPDRREEASEGIRNRRRRPAPRPAPQAGAEAEPRPRQESNRFQTARGNRRPSDPSNNAQAAIERRPGHGKGRAREEREPDERRKEGSPGQGARREAPIDMNSPFAKLLALKSQLEKGKNG
jgi:ATP-dependent RNA helicase SUPV3L1/SUV3